jgi:uncharacterized protein YecE (DUF72 family)
VQLYSGTSGFSYDAWKGGFYPDELKARERLQFYASRLAAVEINNTFYRMPKREMLEGWCDQTPEHFRFAIKASRRITHRKRLKEVDDEVAFLFGQLESLGDRLGIVLFQLPPNLKCDLERLDRFLECVPPAAPIVLEFRNASWREDAVYERLRARDVALCHADFDPEADGDAAAGQPIAATSTTGYLRLRRDDYDEAALTAWVGRVRAEPWERAFVFFKHEGGAPALAARFDALFESRAPARVRTARKRSQQAG